MRSENHLVSSPSFLIHLIYVLPVCRQVCWFGLLPNCATQSSWGLAKMQIQMREVRDGLRFLRFNKLPGVLMLLVGKTHCKHLGVLIFTYIPFRDLVTFLVLFPSVSCKLTKSKTQLINRRHSRSGWITSLPLTNKIILHRGAHRSI